MRIATLTTARGPRVCLSQQGRFYDIAMLAEEAGVDIAGWQPTPGWGSNFIGEAAAQTALFRLDEFIARALEQRGIEALARWEVGDNRPRFLPPIPEMPVFFGIIQNSPMFWRRNSRDRIDTGFVSGFARARGAITAHMERITIPAYTTSFRCATELGVVIGKSAHNITEKNAMDHVFGYTCVNDMIGNCWSAFARERHPESNPSRFELLVNSYYGRNTQGFGPVGPCVVTKDEVPDPYDLLFYTSLSGERRDRSFSNSMLVGIERSLSLLSQFITLMPGSVVHMGTMGIDGITISEQTPLGPEDYIEVEIEKVGTLRNYFKDMRFSS